MTFLSYSLVLVVGYFIGCISPAALMGRLKNVNLKESGTKNLGATNTTLVLGKAAGAFVLVLDMCKAILAYLLAGAVFPALPLAGLVAGIGVMVGHCFPVFLRFQGGKGLAAYGGLVLAFNHWIFLILLTLGAILSFITHYGVAMALSAGSLFPLMVYLQSHDVMLTICAAVAGGFIIFMHRDNFHRARSKDELRVKEFFRTVFKKDE